MSTARSHAASPQSPLRVGDWLVVPANLLLRQGDAEVALEPRVMELLLYLAERQGEVISAEQLLVNVWHGPFYSDAPVQRAMSILRRALGDDPQAPRYIETIRKRGYRLLAEVVLPENYAAHLGRQDATWSEGSPFVGLRAFDAEHSGVFFGRARSTALLLAAMRRQWREGGRLVLLLGASGCGKTSLLNAGVLPLLTRATGFDGIGAAALARADFSEAQAGEALAVLESALMQWKLGDRPVFADRAAIERLLREDPEAMVAATEAAFERDPAAARQRDRMLLLVVDHCEAALSSTPVDLLNLNRALACLGASPRVLLVVICRSDFYPSLLARLPVIAELKQPDGHFDLLPPSPGELAEIIRRPAHAAGLQFEQDEGTRLGLDDVLRDAAIAHPEALPMLQYSLQALYEACRPDYVLRFAAYHRLGGLGGALAKYAEDCFLAMPAPARDALPSLLELLVNSEAAGSALTVRRLPWTALRTDGERDLAERLVGARLLTSALCDGVAQISVTHETLLRAWPRVQSWAETNQRRLQTRQRLQQATQRWQQSGRRPDLLLTQGLPLTEALELQVEAPRLLDAEQHELVRASAQAERRRRSRRQGLLLAALLLTVVSALSAVQAYRAHRDAERRRVQAESLLDYLLTDLAAELRPLGRLALMDHIASRALDYLSQLPQQDADGAARLQRAQALRTLGEVFVERGDSQAAALALAQADRSLGSIAAGDAEPQKVLLETGTVAFWLGSLAFRRGDLDRAEQEFSRYRTAAQALTRREPNRADWQLELSYALNNLGSVASKRGDVARALGLFSESVELKEQVLTRQPDNSALAVEQADSLSWIGSTLERQGRLAEAGTYYQRQLSLLQGIRELDPGADGWRHRLALAQLLRANLDLLLGRSAAADDLYAEARQALQQLVTADPTNSHWQRNLSYAEMQQAYARLLGGGVDEAEVLLRAADARMQVLLSGSEAPAEWVRLGASIQLRRAQAAQRSGANQLAGNLLRTAQSLAAEQLRSDPDGLDARILLARVQVALGDLAVAEGRGDAAQSNFFQARELLSRFMPDSLDHRVLQLWLATGLRLGTGTEPARQRLQASGYQLAETAPP
ncbi:MAG: winged helix-turn-helix domain-containing protein [Lysobacterales bacterium]